MKSIIPLLPEKFDRVHLMLTCLCDAFYPAAGQAVVELLEHCGLSVVFDERQTCCSQPAFNSGDRAAARKVADYWMQVFADAEIIIAPSGSCAAMIRWGFPQLFAGDPAEGHALEMAARTWELTEFLARSGRMPAARLDRKVALHRGCHMRELGAWSRPIELLSSIAGLELADFANSDECCGFGGAFSVGYPWISREIGLQKLQNLQAAGVTELVSTDLGCLMHLDGLRRREGIEMPMRHVAELLAEAVREPAPQSAGEPRA